MVQVIANGGEPPHCAAAVATSGRTGNVVKGVLEPTCTAEKPDEKLLNNDEHMSVGTLVMAIRKLGPLPVTVNVPPQLVEMVLPLTDIDDGTLRAVINTEFNSPRP